MPLVENIDYYKNSDGKYVFLEAYLLKRGRCCNNSCRHCPYIDKETVNNETILHSLLSIKN